MLARLIRGEFDLIDEREMVYYRNVYDHLVRFTELIEASREMVSDLMQTHLAAQVEPAQRDHEGADHDLDDHPADDADRRHLRHELREERRGRTSRSPVRLPVRAGDDGAVGAGVVRRSSGG